MMWLTNGRSNIVQIGSLIGLLLIGHIQRIKSIWLNILIPISNPVWRCLTRKGENEVYETIEDIYNLREEIDIVGIILSL